MGIVIDDTLGELKDILNGFNHSLRVLERRVFKIERRILRPQQVLEDDSTDDNRNTGEDR